MWYTFNHFVVFYFRYLLFYHKKVLEYEWLRRSVKKSDQRVRSNKIITMFFHKLPKKLYILINTVFMSMLQVKQASLPFWSKNPWRLHTNYFLGKSGCANLLFCSAVKSLLKRSVSNLQGTIKLGSCYRKDF